jgi:hypothetical protein
MDIAKIVMRRNLLDLWKTCLYYSFSSKCDAVEDAHNVKLRATLAENVEAGNITEKERDTFDACMSDNVKTNAKLMWSIVDKPRADYEGFLNRLKQESDDMDALADSIVEDYNKCNNE